MSATAEAQEKPAVSESDLKEAPAINSTGPMPLQFRDVRLKTEENLNFPAFMPVESLQPCYVSLGSFEGLLVSLELVSIRDRNMA